LIAFAFDKTIDNEIKKNQSLSEKLTEFKYFHSFQSRPKSLYAVLGLQFRGVSVTLSVVGFLFAFMMYAGLGLCLYFLIQ
jgi:hypothetical protein